MGCDRHRVPAKTEPRKTKGEVIQSRLFNQAKGMLYSIGIREGKSGRVLSNYVSKVLQGVQTA